MTSSPFSHLLTRRQLEAARLAAEGLRVQDIADKMCVAPNTVKTHLRITYSTLGVSNRIGLRVALIQAGLLPDLRDDEEEADRDPETEEGGAGA